MMMEEKVVSKIQRRLNDFLYEEEGNISRSKILTVGSLLLIAGIIFADEVYGAHSSHRSHVSHTSHRSHTSHTSHRSHSSHSSGSHGSHASHSNVVTPTPLPDFQSPQIPPNTPAM